jgi:azurin
MKPFRTPATRRRELLLVGLTTPLWLSACQRRPTTAAPPVNLLVESNGDLLEFRPKELRCTRGAHVRLTFRHTGKYISFQHNWVLILPGTFDAVSEAALRAGEDHGWLPKGDKRILAATPMCGRGQSAVIEFVAPVAGRYLYICTTPGHAASMWGVLNVMEIAS